METLYDILKITVPALLVLITAYLVIRSMLKNDQDRRRQEVMLQTVKVITPVRLQAYERVVLFIERITPESLLIRNATPNITARQLQTLLITVIRNEFEHNLSQQIYMSREAWEMVKTARNTVTRTITSIAAGLPEKATGEELSRLLIEEFVELEKDPCRAAIDFIKAELGRIM